MRSSFQQHDRHCLRRHCALPATGTEEGWCQEPMEYPADHPLVQATRSAAANEFKADILNRQ
jgi:hypothetical protein